MRCVLRMVATHLKVNISAQQAASTAKLHRRIVLNSSRLQVLQRLCHRQGATTESTSAEMAALATAVRGTDLKFGPCLISDVSHRACAGRTGSHRLPPAALALRGHLLLLQPQPGHDPSPRLDPRSPHPWHQGKGTSPQHILGHLTSLCISWACWCSQQTSTHAPARDAGVLVLKVRLVHLEGCQVPVSGVAWSSIRLL